LALQQYCTLDEPVAEWGILVVTWLHEIESQAMKTLQAYRI
jgi:hypothetical protein